MMVFVTPPYETADSLQEWLETMYGKAEVYSSDSGGYDKVNYLELKGFRHIQSDWKPLFFVDYSRFG